MMRFEKYAWLLIGLMLFAGGRQVFAMQADQRTNDVRILIDVSGSMKKNDPKKSASTGVKDLSGFNAKRRSCWRVDLCTLRKYVGTD
jgi:hypothetical protein